MGLKGFWYELRVLGLGFIVCGLGFKGLVVPT